MIGADLDGPPLPTDNSLQTFRVRVRGTNFVSGNGFTVDARMNNLYLKTDTGHDYNNFIESKNVRLGFLTNPVDEVLDRLPVDPTFLLSGTFTCTSVTGALNGLL